MYGIGACLVLSVIIMAVSYASLYVTARRSVAQVDVYNTQLSEKAAAAAVVAAAAAVTVTVEPSNPSDNCETMMEISITNERPSGGATVLSSQTQGMLT